LHSPPIPPKATHPSEEFLFRKLVIYVTFKRINEFSTWNPCLILELIAKYVPFKRKDVFDITSLLGGRN
jgi:hypothetical protein